MKRMVFALTALCVLATGCKEKKSDLVTDNVRNAGIQLKMLLDTCEAGDTIRIPAGLREDGSYQFAGKRDWVSGFFAGELWLMYELTGEEAWAEHAARHTENLSEIQFFTGTHDVGFMVNDSYGQGLRLKGTEAYKDVIVNTAKSLCTRFRPAAGILQSWNSRGGWQCPVIIDNMMNLALLFNATEISGDSTYYRIAVSHADKTMENHFREDGSSFHVVDYNPGTGEVNLKCTSQGHSDSSAWSRGQSWGLYGFTETYEHTGDRKYLEQAERIAGFLLGKAAASDDLVPYWDYNAPDIPDAPRDASAGAIMASALYELYTITGKDLYRQRADKLVESLSGPRYRAEPGTNGGFLLKHSVISFPANSGVDVPLNYADYYFLEALLRRRALK